ncbi:hypothetical protein EAX61_06420 [Dokdonia sinensis]|uniref:HTH luxR-type domain-containing protein n=2 Tax=Dokdonia sinensis TaxID=2479847 RepID=A0A3M0GFS3_9FLAO|nr:hypothetical protein EAX61_06420 [Dokdonia sinensis]
MMKWLFLLLVLITGELFAQSDVLYIYDKEAQEDFTSIHNADFSPILDNNHGLDNGTYWFKIPQIENPREMLTIYSNHTGLLELKDSNGKSLPLMADTRYPSFFLIDRLIEFPLYLKAEFKQEAYFPIEVLEEAEFISSEKHDLLGAGIFYGTILSLIFATLIFFFITKNKIFLFHASLAFVVAYTILARDNFWYLFHAEFDALIYLELFSHFLVGFFGFCFAFYYLKLRHRAKVQKIILISLVSIAAIFMLLYFATHDMFFYFLSDVFTVATIVAVWIIGILKTKNRTIYWLIGLIYIFNIYLMLEISVLHTYGLSLISITTFGAKIFVLIDVVLITFAMMWSFKKLQVQGSLMKQQIKTYLQRIETLDQYKKIQDADDSYLETLISEFNLTNLEVKVLQGISKGHSNEHISTDYRLSGEEVNDTTKSIYKKLGIEGDQEIRMLVS